MSDPNQPSTPAGWYPDGQGGQRWWDGTQWTEHTQPAQGAAPAAPAAPAQPAPPADPTPVDPMQTVVAPRTPAQGLPPQSGAGQPPSGPPPAQQGYPQPGQSSQPGVPPWQGQTPTSGGGGGGKGKLIAIIAGVVALVVIAAVVLFVFVLGGGGPKDVAEDYLEAGLDADLEQVCELSSERSQKEEFESYEVDNCADYADKLEGEEAAEFDKIKAFLEDLDVDTEFGDVSEKNDTAEVKYTQKVEYTGDDDEGFAEYFGEETKFTSKGTIRLVKEDGDWKVDEDESETVE